MYYYMYRQHADNIQRLMGDGEYTHRVYPFLKPNWSE